MDTIELIETIVDRAKIVRAHFVPGYEEKVYKNALYIELVEAGLSVETEVPFNVSYKGHVIGSYKADMIVEKKVIVELKAITTLSPVNEVQLVNYLAATGIDDGILLNFGSERIQIRHRTRLYCPKAVITDI
ncbi:MAG: GxxExxY protein [Prevotella sp.]|nr:GxxExxY protein [Prevotella sp.]MBR3481253.1 GxxExxY protein [Prevotella sp.]MBR6189740.1 GxxExxY protein [Prevotella sp.]